ncbi:hypothetical protein LJR263_005132 [Pseudomonas sp. LjRoot263]|nr:hypothetical protein [Pseudomonas sp. FW305-53]
MLPAQEGLGAAGRDIAKAMPPDLIRVQAGNAVFFQDFSGHHMGFFVQIGTGSHDDGCDGQQVLFVCGIGQRFTCLIGRHVLAP